MYEQFYGFDRAPFANIPDPQSLYLSPSHQRALSILQYALISRAGFCVITGDIGAGKTTLVRRVLQQLDQTLEVGLVSNTQCDSFEELLRWILLAFGLEYRGKDKVEMYDEFVRFLIRQNELGRPVTLIIDEAQNLSIDNLEQLRMLSNVNTEKGQILQTILVGQPELWALLRDRRLEQFAQRVSYDYFLKPLESAELTREYVRFRLQNVGGDPELFPEEVYPLIWQATRGVPRLINLLCDTALVYGYGEEARSIDARLVRRVIADRCNSFRPDLDREPGGTADVGTVGPERGPAEEAAVDAQPKQAGLSTIERLARRKRGEF